MARGLRVEFEGAVYHVMARGNERREIFRNDDDRQRFLETIAESVERFGLRVHAYCLMPNHYHLITETPRGNLSQAMGWLQTTYTVRFNWRHRRVGHLFQGRFKAQLVGAEEYGCWLVRYLHYNPVRPKDRHEPIPKEREGELDRYEWSSHRDYAGRRKPAGWLCLEWLRLWGRSRGAAQRQYRREMASGFGRVLESPWDGLRGGLVLGAEELWRKAKRLIGRKEVEEEIRWKEREGSREVRERAQRMVGEEKDARLQIWVRVRLGGECGRVVAKEFGYRDGSGVTQVVRRLEAAAQADKGLQRRLQRWRKALSIVNG